jgi:hypothetical protein
MSNLAAKTYTGISASFSDTDGNYTGSTATNTVSLTVSKAATAFSITVNGSASSASITYGASATLAESGLPPGATGTVSFTSGSALLCSFVLSSTVTSCPTPATLAAKTYGGITASFSDTDGNYAGSTSSKTVSLTVNKAGTPFSVFVNGSRSASITYGSSAILAESGLPAGATGLVTFFTSSGIPLCAFIAGPLPGGPTTSCLTWPIVPAATYSGVSATFIDLDGNYASSVATNSVTLTVTKAAPKVTWATPAPTPPCPAPSATARRPAPCCNRGRRPCR